MKTGRGWWALAGLIAGSVLLLLTGYVVAYYATVDPWISESPPGSLEHIRFVVEEYRWIEANRAGRIFWPIHQIDKHFIRLSLWKETLPDVIISRPASFPPEN